MSTAFQGKQMTTGSIAVSVAGTVIAILLSASYYVSSAERSQIDPVSFMKSRVVIFAILAVVFAILAIVFVSFWAQSNNGKDIGYLGHPNAYSSQQEYPSGLFAWHPVLMIGGLFSSQVLAASVWTLFGVERKHIATVVHILFQCLGAVSMGLGLYAVLLSESRRTGYVAQLYSTMHSVLGITAIIAFCLNYSLGSCMAILKRFFPHSLWRKHIDLRNNHRKLGAMVLVICGMAGVTGIMNKQPLGVCYPINRSEGSSSIPTSCKISIGLGVVLLLAIVMVLLTALERSEIAMAETSLTISGEDSGTNSKVGVEPVPQHEPNTDCEQVAAAPSHD